MCGRYKICEDDASGAIRAILDMLRRGGAEGDRIELGDICPSMYAPALVKRDGKLMAGALRWGFTGKHGLLINARAETMWDKPSFREAALNGRCILPASGYYEWRRGDGQKYSIANPDGEALYMAGLARRDGTFVVVTMPSDGSVVRAVHDRMPLLLADKEAIDAWLCDEKGAKKIAAQGTKARIALKPEGAEQLVMEWEDEARD